MAKLSNIFVCFALLSLLYSSLQAQAGRSLANDDDAMTEWRPLLNTTLAGTPAVAHPDTVTLKYCDRCTCCNPAICQTFNCCMASDCAREPSTGLPIKSKCTTRPVSCNCNTKTCR